MSSYAIANIQSITMGPAIVEYLERIDASLAPFGGRFLIHGDPADLREGEFRGDLIAIEFTDRDHAQAWYESAAYRDIKPLRSENSEGWVILIGGVPREHRGTDILAASTGTS
jgi:uncharacterized protein (DUF1330 family)